MTLFSCVPGPLLSVPDAAVAVRSRLDQALVRHDGWFLVLVAVLLVLGAGLLAGMAVWCVVSQHGAFTGSWTWHDGIHVYVKCTH